jgi:hypothetical protein
MTIQPRRWLAASAQKKIKFTLDACSAPEAIFFQTARSQVSLLLSSL